MLLKYNSAFELAFENEIAKTFENELYHTKASIATG